MCSLAIPADTPLHTLSILSTRANWSFPLDWTKPPAAWGRWLSLCHRTLSYHLSIYFQIHLFYFHISVQRSFPQLNLSLCLFLSLPAPQGWLPSSTKESPGHSGDSPPDGSAAQCEDQANAAAALLWLCGAGDHSSGVHHVLKCLETNTVALRVRRRKPRLTHTRLSLYSLSCPRLGVLLLSI